MADGRLRIVRRRERLSLESPCGRAQSVLHRIDALIELGGQTLAPERHFGRALLERVQDVLAHPRVTVEQIGGDRNGLRMRAVLPRLQHRFQIAHLGAEDLERPDILVVADQDGDVPSGHHPVVDPAACEPHRVEHGGCNHVEPVPHVELLGASSRPSDSAYPLNTSVSGIEGSSNHRVSIPLMKARISTALLAASKSVRYSPSC